MRNAAASMMEFVKMDANLTVSSRFENKFFWLGQQKLILDKRAVEKLVTLELGDELLLSEANFHSFNEKSCQLTASCGHEPPRSLLNLNQQWN